MQVDDKTIIAVFGLSALLMREVLKIMSSKNLPLHGVVMGWLLNLLILVLIIAVVKSFLI